MEITMDFSGNVEGSITTTVGTHIPNSSIKGVIQNGLLTSKINSDDMVSGTLALRFTDTKTLTGNVKLDNHDSPYTVAEGNLSFERYTVK